MPDFGLYVPILGMKSTRILGFHAEDGLGLEVAVQSVRSKLAADAGLLEAAKRGNQVIVDAVNMHPAGD
jgi:hypothetical protein